MGAVVLAAGASGFLVQDLQVALAGHGYSLVADGQYRSRTALTVSTFQRDNDLPSTGEVDAVTWRAIIGRGAPCLLQRSLQLTASFDGRAFGLALGDFDGHGITWGIAGFTLANGELQHILADALATAPGLVDAAFGPETPELRDLLSRPFAEQLAWAAQHSTGQHRIALVEPWRHHFRDFGEHPEIRALQTQRVRETCYAPAVAEAAKAGLRSELGVTLCFHVLMGGGRVPGGYRPRPGAERERRIDLANVVAAATRPSQRNDVRARNLTIARGDGTVHGVPYALRSWGLDESAAMTDKETCRVPAHEESATA